MDLTDTETAILDLEQQWFARTGTKDAAIWEQFGVLPARYYQQLAHLLEQPEAAAYAPMLVRRLQRLSEARRHARSGSLRSGPSVAP